MNNKIRNQVLIGGLIIVIGIAIYFSGITSTQEDECEVVGRQGGNAAGAGIQDCDDSIIQGSTIPQIIIVLGIVLIIRGIMTMKNSSLE
jgi:uncharacterized membrane protein|tara:strand:+ start:335 stop:601 length:267 start_codon:yes stop_codon:yes gene_type:complete